jgi:hypothetical protein
MPTLAFRDVHCEKSEVNGGVWDRIDPNIKVGHIDLNSRCSVGTLITYPKHISHLTDNCCVKVLNGLIDICLYNFQCDFATLFCFFSPICTIMFLTFHS